ncbi:hypothetical protein [Nonomuraea maritima]|nr:hypothetical protein [Nonomuraea maritima]
MIAKVRLTTRMEEPAMAKLIRSVHDEAPRPCACSTWNKRG